MLFGSSVAIQSLGAFRQVGAYENVVTHPEDFKLKNRVSDHETFKFLFAGVGFPPPGSYFKSFGFGHCSVGSSVSMEADCHGGRQRNPKGS